METLSFTLGVLAVIDLTIVAGTFLVLKTLNITRKKAEDTQKQIEQTQKDLQYEMERLERDVIQLNNDLSYNINKVEGQVVRHIDSRVDKLEAKVYKDFDLYRIQGKNY